MRLSCQTWAFYSNILFGLQWRHELTQTSDKQTDRQTYWFMSSWCHSCSTDHKACVGCTNDVINMTHTDDLRADNEHIDQLSIHISKPPLKVKLLCFSVHLCKHSHFQRSQCMGAFIWQAAEQRLAIGYSARHSFGQALVLVFVVPDSALSAFSYYVAARRHICFCFMAKSAFWRGFSALAPYTGVGPI